MRTILIHNTDTIGVSPWYLEQAYRRVKPDDFKSLKPNKVMRQIADQKLSPPDYFLIAEGGIMDYNCTRDLADIGVPKIMWLSDSYPVPGYMDYFPFEVAWAKVTKPDLILMMQNGKVKDMQEATGISTFWLPPAGEQLYHHEVGTEPYYDISYVGTINPNKDHADQRKVEALTKLHDNGFKVRATIAHDGDAKYNFEWRDVFFL